MGNLSQLSALCQANGIKAYGAPLYAKLEGTETFTLNPKTDSFTIEDNTLAIEADGVLLYATIRSSTMEAMEAMTAKEIADYTFEVSILEAVRDASGTGDYGDWSVSKGDCKLFAE
jgi:hypothetical protein